MSEVHQNGEATIAFAPYIHPSEPMIQPAQPLGKAYPVEEQPEGRTFPVMDQPEGGTYPVTEEPTGRPFPVGDEPLGRTFPVDQAPSPDKKFEIPTAKLSEVKVTDYMRECLDKVASSEGFNNYDIKVDHGSAIGDGFVGLMFKATIQEIDSDKNLTVLLKSPPENHARRHDFGALALFKREVFVYNQVLPEFVKFQEMMRVKKAEGFFEFPKCYLAEYNEEKDDSVIIMEDLRDSGHKMWNKFIPANLEHAKLIMAALGRLHAVSFAMKEMQPEAFEKFKGLDDFMSGHAAATGFQSMLATSIEKAADCLDPTDTKRRARVLMLKENVGTLMRDMTNPDAAEPYTIVTHGDCWTNNFMFHYRVSSLCLTRC